MTRRHSSRPHAQHDVGLGETRSRFLVARQQAAAHASTADYLQIRAMARWADREATPESSRQTSSNGTT
jgi:hypothetical protein